ncbi:MAG TPA: tetratricopeptide repeat protein [Chitinophagales bacterium]|nr:tetratricopeptide repeat protein [Chitinophagales bacterium]
MAKQNKRQTADDKQQTSKVVAPAPSAQANFKLPQWFYYAFIFVFTCLLYSNTLWNRYAIDDTIVVTDNKFTKKGFGGIKDHFTHDMFEGFFGERGAKLVSGGRYRPLSMTSLAVEYEIVRKMRGDKREVIDDKNIIMTDADPYLNPMLSHGINILLFALTCVLLYYLLLQIIPKKYSLQLPFGELGLAFLATLLYAAHPLHTEAVANIKGRDEVMCMLLSLLALLATIKYVRTQNIVHLVWGVVVYFIALMSKENAITFLAIIPLTYYFFTNAKAKDYILSVGLYLVPVALFLFLRSQFTQSGLTDESPEILNNPFVAPHNEFSIRYGTTLYTFLRYYWLMIFPHPLTHDYYYNQVPYLGFDSGLVITAILSTIGLLAYAAIKLKEKSIAAFGILFFFITFSVASNMLFTVGVLMNERFIYMSSLGFSILVAYMFIESKDRFKLSPTLITGVFVIVLALYSVKTFARNYDWKDSFTLFRRDAIHSPNSSKIQTSLGGDLTKAAESDIPALRDSGMIKSFFKDLNRDLSESDLNAINMLPDSSIRFLLLDSSIAHLNEAIRIYPTHSNAYLLLGNAVYKRYHKPELVVPIYEKAAAFRVGGYYDANFNLGIVYNETNQPLLAKENLLKAYAAKPEQVECRFLLAQMYAKLNKPDSVQIWLNKGNEIRPATAADYYQIGTGFGKTAYNFPMAIEYLKKAVELNPKVELYYEDLGVAYGLSGRFDEAIATALKLIELNPNYPAAYMNLSVSYRNKGNKALADQYQAKFNEVMAAQKR